MSGTPQLSVVVPVYNEEAVLDVLYSRLTAVLERSGLPYEIVLVNDGSRDSSLARMLELRRRDPRVAVLDLSRNFGHQLALTAGLDHARGDAVVAIDADLQDPPEVILEMLARWHDGYDVVYGQRAAREGETIFKRATAALFYRLLRGLTSVDVPVDTGDFRLMSRRVLEAMKGLREHHRFLRGMVAWAGFRQTAVRFTRAPRLAGETKYPLHKMLRFALDATVSFSMLPLRLAMLAGFFVAAASFAYALFAILARIFGWAELPGWASLMVAIMFLGGVQLIALGIVGEYIGRIYEEVKGRPLYLVGEWHHGDGSDRPQP